MHRIKYQYGRSEGLFFFFKKKKKSEDLIKIMSVKTDYPTYFSKHILTDGTVEGI
jgi:hypothetical protein